MSRTAVEMIELLVESIKVAEAAREDIVTLMSSNTASSKKKSMKVESSEIESSLEVQRVDAMISSLEHCIVKAVTMDKEMTEDGRLAVKAQREIEFIEYAWGPHRLYASEMPAFREKAELVKDEYMDQLEDLDEYAEGYYWKYATLYAKFKMAGSLRDYMRYCREVTHTAEWEAFHAKWIADHPPSSSNSSTAG